MKHGRLRTTLLAGACVFTHRWVVCCRAATLSIPYLLNSITQSKAKVGWYSLGSLTSAMICDVTANENVAGLNAEARAIMSDL